MLEQEIQMANGVWRILKKGDEICIVDPEGRSRHQSKGHINTAAHLAMQLAKNELVSEPNADESLRIMVDNFRTQE